MRPRHLAAVLGLSAALLGAADRKLTSEAAVNSVTFLEGGKELAGYCADNKLRIWDLSTGSLKKTLAKDEIKPPLTTLVRGQASSTAGELQADSHMPDKQSGVNIVRVRNAAGKQTLDMPSGIGGISILGFSPDGSSLVAGSYDADFRVWNARNGELLRRVEELPVSMFAMSFSPDGRWLATAGVDRIVYLWDAKTWKLARKITGQPEMISALSFSPDGKRLVTGGFSELTNKHPVKVILWDVATGKQVRSFDAPQQVTSTAFSPDGKWIAAAYRDKAVSLLPAE